MEDLRESAENLSVDQLLAAISRIDSALEPSDKDLEAEQDGEELLARCAVLEQRLEEEQSKRRQLELAYGSIISTTYELNQQLGQQENAQRLKAELLQTQRESARLLQELQREKEERKVAETSREKANRALAILQGDREVLARMSLSQLLSVEKQLLKALSVVHEVKSQAKSEGALCVICEERKLGVLLRPCNHVCACWPCAERLTTCPICRVRLTSKEKIFIQ